MRLLISCPNCDTSYEVDENQIKESGGQARCFNCQHVFNALMHSQPVMNDDSVMQTPLSDSAPVSSFDNDSITPDTQINLDTRDVNSLFNNNLKMQDLSGPDDDALQSTRPLRPEEILDIKTDDLPSIEPLKTAGKPAAKSASIFSTLMWSLAVIILLAGALAQLGWFNRFTLLNNAQARQVIEDSCNTFKLPCKLPPRRAPSEYEIVDRKISLHPDVSGVLTLSILFSNTATFEQPAPGIELSLFDSNKKLIARRSFLPEDYLHKDSESTPLYARNHVQKISLNLEDPGSDVTGFEFDFF